MRSFFYVGKPVSQNDRHGKIPGYQTDLRNALNAARGTINHMYGPTNHLYGVVYYFRKRKTSRTRVFDADNISKPLWDALQNVCYLDDVVIKLRLAGVITEDYNSNFTIPFTGLSTNDINIVTTFFATSPSDHMIYVFLDNIQPSHFKFRL